MKAFLDYIRFPVLAMLLTAFALVAHAETPAPPADSSTATPKDATQPKAAPSTPAPSPPPTTTPQTPAPAASPPAPPAAPTTPGDKSPGPAPKTSPTPDKPAAGQPGTEKLAPDTKPDKSEIEPNGSPGVPQNATTETVTVPARPMVMVSGKSSYDDAFTSIKGSLATVKAAMEKAGLQPAGHPITIFSEPDKDGFKYQAGIPIAAKPDKVDLAFGATIGDSPSGKAIKFQHRGGYEDIDSTYDVITTFLDSKGLQVDSPYIEEYLTDLTKADDPNLQVDIYVFMK